MPCILDEPNWAVCPSFKDPEWKFLTQSTVNSHQGDHLITLEEAAQQMKMLGPMKTNARLLPGTTRSCRTELSKMSGTGPSVMNRMPHRLN